jgi:hypothetical protein
MASNAAPAMAQGAMDHDRINNVDKALEEHNELTREQVRNIVKRMDAAQVQAMRNTRA